MPFPGMFSTIPYTIFQIKLCTDVMPLSDWLCIVLVIKTSVSYHIVVHKFHSLALRISGLPRLVESSILV